MDLNLLNMFKQVKKLKKQKGNNREPIYNLENWLSQRLEVNIILSYLYEINHQIKKNQQVRRVASGNISQFLIFEKTPKTQQNTLISGHYLKSKKRGCHVKREEVKAGIGGPGDVQAPHGSHLQTAALCLGINLCREFLLQNK